MWWPTDSFLTYLKTVEERLDVLEREKHQLGLAIIERLREENSALADDLVATFNDADVVAEWLTAGVSSLGNRRPIVLIRSGGLEEFRNMLGRIQHGIPG